MVLPLKPAGIHRMANLQAKTVVFDNDFRGLLRNFGFKLGNRPIATAAILL